MLERWSQVVILIDFWPRITLLYREVHRELGSARLRGPDALGRPSEPELDNASEGRAYLFTFLCATDSRSGVVPADTPKHLVAEKSYVIEGPRDFAEKRAPIWTGH